MKIRNLEIKQRVLTNFTPLAALALGIFVASSFFILHDYVLGASQLLSLSILLFIFPYLIKKSQYAFASNLLALIGMFTIMPWLITGGYAKTGFMWSLVYVVGVYFITIKRHAIIWLTLYLMIAIVIVLFSKLGYYKIAYSTPELINYLVMYIFTFAFINQFDYVREYYLKLSIQNEKALNQKNEELKAANVELAQFAYVASHDLKEPLLTISGFVNVLENKYGKKGDEETDQYYSFITNAVKRMQLLIADLLNLSRIGNQISFAMVDCNVVLKNVLKDLEASIQENKAIIKVDTMPIIKGNEVEINLLFQNLISNAIKFKKLDVAPEIKITSSENNDEYIFKISDNGIGIDAIYHEKIFTIFQRLHSADAYDGSGIGLSICKKIVALHKGKLGVKSNLNEGSTFYFTISKFNVV